MDVSVDEMQARLVRYDDLVACTTAFIDARTPGSDRKENFCIIGPGVAENPGQHIHVRIPHGFNIGGARQPRGCVNSQHSHVSEEVFMVHSGTWAFRWGERGEDGEVVLNSGDTISIPVNVFRGFECVSDEPGYLFAILGRDDPGHVTWAPYVFEQAREHGLVLTEAGRLIDTAIGESIPEGDRPCTPTSTAEVAAMRRMQAVEMSECVIRADEAALSADTTLAIASTGLREAALLGPANAAEAIGAGKVGIPHGFHFRKLVLDAVAHVPAHAREEEEVLFVHQGVVALEWDGNRLELGRGDTLTVPKGLMRSWTAGEGGAIVFVVRGGDSPAAPRWSAGQAA